MLFNPLIVLISLFFTIISLIVITCEISYIWGRLCYFKLLSYWQEVPIEEDEGDQEEQEVYHEIQDEEQNNDQSLQDNQQVQDITECVICTSPIFHNEGIPAVLPCGHMYHYQCIDGWIGNRGQNICPIDRRQTNREQILRLIV